VLVLTCHALCALLALGLEPVDGRTRCLHAERLRGGACPHRSPRPGRALNPASEYARPLTILANLAMSARKRASIPQACCRPASWKSALRAAMRVLEEPTYLKAQRLAAVRRGIEETVEKFGDQYPRQKDKMISWGSCKYS
jgi:hypothetical protein